MLVSFRTLITFLTVFHIVNLSRAAEPASSDAETLSPKMALQASRSRMATYRVDFRVAIKPPDGTQKLSVWLPLPPSTEGQTVTDRKIETFPRAVEPTIQSESEFDNTFAYFEFESPKGAQLIRHKFTAQIHQLNWDVDYSQVSQPDKWPASFATYHRPDPRAESGDQLGEILDEIEAATRSDASADRLLSAMRWVDQNLTYDHGVASLSANPMHAMVHRRGHCSDYHGLCGTLASKIGYPSRVLYGLQMFDKGSPSHCKLDVFLPPYGWVSYDLSETQKLAIKVAQDDSVSEQQRETQVRAIKQRTTRGFRENTWLMVTRGVNFELAPPASMRVPIVREIYAEADGVPLADPNSSADRANVSPWMTMYQVDSIDGASRRFQTLD